jgi:hypothetical protein
MWPEWVSPQHLIELLGQRGEVAICLDLFDLARNLGDQQKLIPAVTKIVARSGSVAKLWDLLASIHDDYQRWRQLSPCYQLFVRNWSLLLI